MIIDKKDVIVGFCNDGYYDFCKNWLLSLQNLNLNDRVIVYALDETVFERLNEEFPLVKSILWKDQSLFSDADEKFVELVGEGWDVIMFKKLECVHHTLTQKHNVLYTDTDVVFQKDPMEFLINETEQDDFVIQREGRKDNMWCAGFFYAKSCVETINLTKLSPELCKDFNCDQPLLNARLSVESGLPLARVYSRNNVQEKVVANGWNPSNNLKWHRLCEELFPNGNRWMGMRSKSRKHSYAVHYNCLTGYQDKVDTMKQYNHWFL